MCIYLHICIYIYISYTYITYIYILYIFFQSCKLHHIYKLMPALGPQTVPLKRKCGQLATHMVPEIQLKSEILQYTWSCSNKLP